MGPSLLIHQTQEYLVRHQEKVLGPFGTDFIEAMVMSGVYPASVSVQKVGTTIWMPFSNVISGHNTPIIMGQNASLAVMPTTITSNPTSKRKPSPSKKIENVVAWLVGSFGVLVVLWIIGTVASSGSRTKARASSVVETSNAAAPTTRTEASETSKNQYSSPSRASRPPAITEDTGQIYRDAYGRTYRVSNSDYSRLLSMKSALTTKQTSLNAEKTRLKALSAELDQDRLYLDQTSQYAVDAFNRKVGQVNNLNDRMQFSVNDFNKDVDAFNTELERVGTPIH